MQSYQRFQHVGHTAFNTSGTNGPRSLSRAKVGTHSAFGEGSHTRAHTPKHGVFWVGALSLPSDCFTRFGNPAWPGVRTAYFAAFWPWSGVLPENAESLRNSDALMRVAVPRRRGPAGLRDPCRLLYCTGEPQGFVIKDRELCWRGCLVFACDAGDSSLVTAVRFLNRCSRRSMRGTCPSEQRSGCQF